MGSLTALLEWAIFWCFAANALSQLWHARILLCDLAGSERLKKSDVESPGFAPHSNCSEFCENTSKVSGDAQKEAIEINKYLPEMRARG